MEGSGLGIQLLCKIVPSITGQSPNPLSTDSSIFRRIKITKDHICDIYINGWEK